jgi:hypothetical protein
MNGWRVLVFSFMSVYAYLIGLILVSFAILFSCVTMELYELCMFLTFEHNKSVFCFEG